MNHPIKFLDGENQTKLVPASLSDSLELLEGKTNFSLKRVIIITFMSSLHYKETN